MSSEIKWVSSYKTDFNYDFHVTLDDAVVPPEYNFQPQEELEKRDEPHFRKGEQHGLSVFFRMGDEVFHTYSTYARGCEGLPTPITCLIGRPMADRKISKIRPPVGRKSRLTVKRDSDLREKKVKGETR